MPSPSETASHGDRQNVSPRMLTLGPRERACARRHAHPPITNVGRLTPEIKGSQTTEAQKVDLNLWWVQSGNEDVLGSYCWGSYQFVCLVVWTQIWFWFISPLFRSPSKVWQRLWWVSVRWVFVNVELKQWISWLPQYDSCFYSIQCTKQG